MGNGTMGVGKTTAKVYVEKSTGVTFKDVAGQDEAKEAMAAAIKADIFISGHVHYTVLEKRGNTVFLNPGSPSLSKREDGRQTCAVISDVDIKVYDVNTAEVLAEFKF